MPSRPEIQVAILMDHLACLCEQTELHACMFIVHNRACLITTCSLAAHVYCIQPRKSTLCSQLAFPHTDTHADRHGHTDTHRDRHAYTHTDTHARTQTDKHMHRRGTGRVINHQGCPRCWTIIIPFSAAAGARSTGGYRWVQAVCDEVPCITTVRRSCPCLMKLSLGHAEGESPLQAELAVVVFHNGHPVTARPSSVCLVKLRRMKGRALTGCP